ncbi:hypothetical protein ACJX0J_015365, partial [Zea mays]
THLQALYIVSNKLAKGVLISVFKKKTCPYKMGWGITLDEGVAIHIFAKVLDTAIFAKVLETAVNMWFGKYQIIDGQEKDKRWKKKNTTTLSIMHIQPASGR